MTFLNSNFLTTLTTFAVGCFAIFLYWKQKRDYKRDAASIILMEIRYAEDAISKIKGGAIVKVEVSLLPTNNWSKYNYLFVNDLDRDGLDLLNNFYTQCILIDKSLPRLDQAAYMDNKIIHMTDVIVKMAHDISKETIPVDEKRQKYLSNIQKFIEVASVDQTSISPEGPRQNIISALSSISPISTSVPVAMLKKIANQV